MFCLFLKSVSEEISNYAADCGKMSFFCQATMLFCAWVNERKKSEIKEKRRNREATAQACVHGGGSMCTKTYTVANERIIRINIIAFAANVQRKSRVSGISGQLGLSPVVNRKCKIHITLLFYLYSSYKRRHYSRTYSPPLFFTSFKRS